MPHPPTFVKGFHDEALCQKMEYRSFGKTGMQVSKLSFGCGVLSDLYGFDEEEAIETVRKAIKSGINYLDTAPYYGQGTSERTLGKALKGIPREAYYVATKVGRYEKTYEKMFDYSAKKTRESVENSLSLLGLDYIDVVQIHDIEFASDIDYVLKETLTELQKMVKEGKIKFIGVSAYPMKNLKEIILASPGSFQTVLCYSRYTLLDRSLEEYLPFFLEQGLAVICAAGHALGLLTNQGWQNWHPASDEMKQLCAKAANICKDENVQLGKLAMWFYTQLEGPSTFLTGMQTRELFDMNMKSFYDGLTKKEQEVLKRLQETVFTKSVNWEGIELERYWSEMKKKSKK